jgi:AcrR family transcriptional regulator
VRVNDVRVNAGESTARARRVSAEVRRPQVLAAARQVFMDRGYGGTSMRDIAKAIGVNQAALYRISPSKQSLFEEAVAMPLEDAVNRLVQQALEPDLSRAEATNIHEISLPFVRDLLATMNEIAPLLAVVLTVDRDSSTRFYRTHVEPALDRVTEVSAANLPLWAHGPFDLSVLIRALFGMCMFLAMDQRYGSNPPRDPDDLAPALLNIILDGLRARQDPIRPGPS